MTARKVRHLRESLGLTQEQFARRLGVARVTVTRWENRTRRPSRIASLAIRTALETKDALGWRNLAGAALNKLWDNGEDAIYDEWKVRYRPQVR